MERAPQLARRPHDADDVMERELERESVQRANPLRGAHADTGSAPATEAHLLFAALAIDAAVLCVVLCSQISILLGLMKRSSVSDGARPWNTSTAHVHTTSLRTCDTALGRSTVGCNRSPAHATGAHAAEIFRHGKTYTVAALRRRAKDDAAPGHSRASQNSQNSSVVGTCYNFSATSEIYARKGPGCMYIHEYYADDTPKKSEREGSN